MQCHTPFRQDQVTFTITVFQSAATGTVLFREYPTPASDPVTLASVPLTNGHASWTTSSLSVGLHYMNAAYMGDANYIGTSTSLLNQVVRAVTTTTVG